VGLHLARGELIARMDADDVSELDRLERQVSFLNANPLVGVCGSWVKTIGERDGEIWRYVEDDAVIRCRLLFESALAHPAVMMRASLVRQVGGYDVAFPSAQDYDLWVRLAAHTRLANLPVVLVQRRIYAAQKSQQDYRSGVADVATRTNRLRQLERLGLKPSQAELNLHQALSHWQFQTSRSFLDDAGAWLTRIRAANALTGCYSSSVLDRVLGQRWHAVCLAGAAVSAWAIVRFCRSPLAWAARLSGRQWWQLIRTGLRARALPAGSHTRA
jgi:hypothetical protein